MYLCLFLFLLNLAMGDLVVFWLILSPPYDQRHIVEEKIVSSLHDIDKYKGVRVMAYVQCYEY